MSEREQAGGGSGPRAIGRYLLYDEIAAGGMATVHAGRLVGPAGFSRTVAIKRLHPQFAKDPEFVAMLLDEALLASRIRHPNVVPTLDVVAAQGEVCLVMEFVQGESLSRLLRAARKQRLEVPPRIVSAIISQVLLGLHAAHEATSERGHALSIVHRDVSPQNVLVGADGVARVLDFGIAKAASRLQTTHDGKIKGKLAYMSPEQLRRKAVDRKTDIFASGVLLWEALVGDRLFASDDPAAAVAAILECDVEPPSKRCPGLPAALDEVVLKALSVKPEARYATAREMALALGDALPPANTLEVADWVERLAGANLRQRAHWLAEIESSVPSVLDPEQLALVASRIGVEDSSTSSLSAASSAEAPPRKRVASVPEPTLSGVAAPAPARSRARLFLLGGVLLTGVGVAVWLRIGAGDAEGVEAASPLAAESARPPPATPVAEASKAASVKSARAAESAALPTDSAAPAESALPAEATGRRVVTQKPKAGSTKPKGKNCDPPYVIGADGLKRFKPECF